MFSYPEIKVVNFVAEEITKGGNGSQDYSVPVEN